MNHKLQKKDIMNAFMNPVISRQVTLIIKQNAMGFVLEPLLPEFSDKTIKLMKNVDSKSTKQPEADSETTDKNQAPADSDFVKSSDKSDEQNKTEKNGAPADHKNGQHAADQNAPSGLVQQEANQTSENPQNWVVIKSGVKYGPFAREELIAFVQSSTEQQRLLIKNIVENRILTVEYFLTDFINNTETINQVPEPVDDHQDHSSFGESSEDEEENQNDESLTDEDGQNDPVEDPQHDYLGDRIQEDPVQVNHEKNQLNEKKKATHSEGIWEGHHPASTGNPSGGHSLDPQNQYIYNPIHPKSDQNYRNYGMNPAHPENRKRDNFENEEIAPRYPYQVPKNDKFNDSRNNQNPKEYEKPQSRQFQEYQGEEYEAPNKFNQKYDPVMSSKPTFLPPHYEQSDPYRQKINQNPMYHPPADPYYDSHHSSPNELRNYEQVYYDPNGPKKQRPDFDNYGKPLDYLDNAYQTNDIHKNPSQRHPPNPNYQLETSDQSIEDELQIDEYNNPYQLVPKLQQINNTLKNKQQNPNSQGTSQFIQDTKFYPKNQMNANPGVEVYPAYNVRSQTGRGANDFFETQKDPKLGQQLRTAHTKELSNNNKLTMYMQGVKQVQKQNSAEVYPTQNDEKRTFFNQGQGIQDNTELRKANNPINPTENQPNPSAINKYLQKIETNLTKNKNDSQNNSSMLSQGEINNFPPIQSSRLASLTYENEHANNQASYQGPGKQEDTKKSPYEAVFTAQALKEQALLSKINLSYDDVYSENPIVITKPNPEVVGPKPAQSLNTYPGVNNVSQEENQKKLKPNPVPKVNPVVESKPRDPYDVYNQKPQFYEEQTGYGHHRNPYPEYEMSNRINPAPQMKQGMKPTSNQIQNNYGNVPFPPYDMGMNSQKNYKHDYPTYPPNRGYQEYQQGYDMPPNYRNYKNQEMEYPPRNNQTKQDYDYDYNSPYGDSNYNARKAPYQHLPPPMAQGYPPHGIKPSPPMYQGYAPEPPRMKPQLHRDQIEQNDPYNPYNRGLNQYERHESSSGHYGGGYAQDHLSKYNKVPSYNREVKNDSNPYSQGFDDRNQPRQQYGKPDYNKISLNKGSKGSKKAKPKNRDNDTPNYYNKNNSQNEGGF